MRFKLLYLLLFSMLALPSFGSYGFWVSVIRRVYSNGSNETLGYSLYDSNPSWQPSRVLERFNDGGYVSEIYMGYIAFTETPPVSGSGPFFFDFTGDYNSFQNSLSSSSPPPYVPWQPDGPTDNFPWNIIIEPPADGDYTVILQGMETINNSILSETQTQNTRINELKALLGAAGNSWIYDCKLSLHSLEQLVSSLHLEPPVVNVEAPVVNVAAPVVNVPLDSLESGLSQLDTSVRTVNQSILDLGDNITSVFSGDLPNVDSLLALGDGPSLPSELAGIENKALQSFGVLSAWGENGAYDGIDFNPLNTLLNKFVGSIPSVGTDSTIFTVSFSVPYLGEINRTFLFSDYPACSYLRDVLLFALYLFFGLACFRLVLFTLN